MVDIHVHPVSPHTDHPEDRYAVYKADHSAILVATFSEHFNAGIEAFINNEPVLVLSCAPDMSRVGGICFYAAACILPNDVAFWAIVQDRR